MSGQTLPSDVPGDVVQLLGSPTEAEARAKEALIMSLLREGSIGQSRAAELLGVSRWDVLDLMARHDVASDPATADEVDAELDAGLRALSARQD
jgi:predicted HTH domain antitoxin